VLTLEKITFQYGTFRKTAALNDLSWSIPPGRRTVLLGPNGAGKTTLLKILAGYSAPDSGHVFGMEGRRLTRRELCTTVAWMPQEISIIRGLTVREQVAYASWLSGQSRVRAEALADQALHQVLLDDKKQSSSHTLSGGQRRRMGLAEALSKDGSTIVLDEPTAGLDPAQRKNFREIIRDLPKDSTIVVSTHQVDDLDELFDHVAVLVEGQIVFDGTLDDFKRLGLNESESLEDIFTDIVRGGLH